MSAFGGKADLNFGRLDVCLYSEADVVMSGEVISCALNDDLQDRGLRIQAAIVSWKYWISVLRFISSRHSV